MINIIKPGIFKRPTITTVNTLIGINKSSPTAIRLKTYKINGATTNDFKKLITFFKTNTSKKYMNQKINLKLLFYF